MSSSGITPRGHVGPTETRSVQGKGSHVRVSVELLLLRVRTSPLGKEDCEAETHYRDIPDTQPGTPVPRHLSTPFPALTPRRPRPTRSPTQTLHFGSPSSVPTTGTDPEHRKRKQRLPNESHPPSSDVSREYSYSERRCRKRLNDLLQRNVDTFDLYVFSYQRPTPNIVRGMGKPWCPGIVVL